MKRLLVLLVTTGLLGCQGAIDLTSDGGPPPPPPTCPSGQKLVCINDIDDGTICKCELEGFDPCLLYPDKYCAAMPVPPDGSNDWECTWTEFKYTCKRPPDGKTPDGGSDWTCKEDSEGNWVCTKGTVPKPTGGGEWTCFTDNKNKVLVCNKKPDGELKWGCTTGADGKQTCTSTGGLPTGGSNWKCHKSGSKWVCYGDTTPGSPPPGGGSWQCVKMKTELGKDIYKCEKQGDDLPPGGGSGWTCVKGSEFNGTKCIEGPPGIPPKVGGQCKVGDKAWCDGNLYCGWGQVVCDPKTGTWETEVKGGKPRLKCYEINDLRPNTQCACYFFIYNQDCCERPDCIIPAGTSGQVCNKSAGKLCDYCDPRPGMADCTEPGGMCIVSSKHETFCGSSCSASKPCPAGYLCKSIKSQSGLFVKQCAPTDLSCYY